MNTLTLRTLMCGWLLAGWAPVQAQTGSASPAAPLRETKQASTANPRFRWTAKDDRSLELWEGLHPVLVYNHGVISHAGVPADRNRSSYIHPLYGLDGEVLTDDFPKDHYHHRGLFWSWPHVTIDGQAYDLWMLQGIRHEFVRWLQQETGPAAADLKVENGWFVGPEKVMAEKVWVRVWPEGKDERVIDLDFEWTPLSKPITLAGAEGKSYGGLTLRFATNQNTVITTPQGQSKEDLYITRLPWADFSGQFAGNSESSGAALFIHPTHPDYPPEWLTRHYGVLCIGWPGVQAKTFPPGEVIRCRYRVWVHRGATSPARLKAAYEAYLK